MDTPKGFRKWRFHWFECPACQHRAYRVWANVSVGRQPTRMVWRFWCERCGAYCTLRQPMMPSWTAAAILLLVGPIAFVFIYRAMLAGLSFEWLVLLFGVVWISYPLVFLAITRWAYRYVPAPQ
ncbi:MAG: hypothetical protein QOD26_1625 [Betaproteobacteria bacterium]|jgi:hypothetical protein|nr:hypothetical protein [Betaproteobacteria bacterium]